MPGRNPERNGARTMHGSYGADTGSSRSAVLEAEADEILRVVKEAERAAAKAEGKPYEQQHPWFTEEYLAEKRARHEDRYASVPESGVGCWVLGVGEPERNPLRAEDLFDVGARAGLTDDQWFVFTDWFLDRTVMETVIHKAKAQQRRVSFNAVKKMLQRGLRKVLKQLRADRYEGWFLVYLEDVLRRRLF